ncbi:DNA-binding response regulator [Leucobacter zeae]|nr:DNA-binding response regulator [Leucobacter zeae]
MTLSVLIVDDHPVVRSGLRAVIEAGGAIRVAGEASTGAAAVALAAELHPDVVLCDLRLGDGMDGIATTVALRALERPPAVLILTTFDRDAEILGALEAGAAGYLLKEVDPDAIVTGIRRAAAGETVLSPGLAARVIGGMRNPLPRLTAREVEVLRQLATGATNRQIARELFVAEATVKSHVAHIYTKLGVDGRSRAIRVAQETGLI